MADLNVEILTAPEGYGLHLPLEPFDLPAQGTNNQTKAFESPSGRFVWRAYLTHSERETILWEHELLEWLSRRSLSVAVPVPVPMSQGDTLYQDERGFHALFPMIPGTAPDRLNLTQMESVGAALGELHRTLASYPKTARPGLATYGTIERVHSRIPDPATMEPGQFGMSEADAANELFAWWRSAVRQVQQWQRASYHRLPQQVIHGDFTPTNTLVVDDSVSAMLDFDFALLDVRAMDVAAGLYFAMRIWDNPDPWPVARAFCLGYSGWIRLCTAEIAAIAWLMRLRSIVSVVWWFGKEASANRPLSLWRIEDLRFLDAWLEENDQELMQLFSGNRSIS